jgi:hypothetical protein
MAIKRLSAFAGQAKPKPAWSCAELTLRFTRSISKNSSPITRA